MPELLYNPFRHRLRVAIPLKNEEYIKNISDKVQEDDKIKEKEMIFNRIGSLKAPPQTASSKVSPEELKTPTAADVVTNNFANSDFISYITFHQFCLYLSVYCPRTPIDNKITCNLNLVLYRLYDFDEDGVLNAEDLTLAIKTMTNQNMSLPEIQEVVKSIFREVDTAEKAYVDKEDFQKVLWLTDFDQKTSLYF